MEIKKRGVFVVVVSVFMIIFTGCGGGDIGSSSNIGSFSLTRNSNGFVTNVATILSFSSPTLKALENNPNLECTIEYGGFQIDSVTCDDKNISQPTVKKIAPVKITSANYVPVNVSLSIDINDSNACKDVKYFTFRYDQNSSCHDKYLSANKDYHKEISAIAVNPDYSSNSLSFYKNIVTYSKKMVNSKIAVATFENEYNATTYIYNGKIEAFINSTFKESNATFGDWVLVPNKKISYLISDINESNITGEIVVNKNIGKINNNTNIDAVVALSKCSFDFNESSVGYNCPEANRSKIYIIEYNTTDALYESADNF